MQCENEKKSWLQVDLLHGSIMKSLLIFAMPLLISRIFQQLYNTADTMIVGYYLGDTSLAAIGSCGAIYDLLVGFALGVGSGLAIVTARSFGQGDRELLKKSVASSMLIGGVSALGISVIGGVSLYPLLEILHTPEEIIAEAYQYLLVITASIIVMFAYNLCAGLLRAIGNSVVPLIFLLFSSVLNVALDILFIAKLGMGVQGAAVATALSQVISVILCVIYIFWKAKILIPEKRHFKVDKKLYREMLEQGFSMGFMSSIVSVGSVILQYGINELGYLIIAAHTTARKIYLFFNMPFSSMALAISTFVSQNRGADQRDRICKSMKIVFIYDFVMAAICSVILFFFAEDMIRIVSGSEERAVLENGALYMKIVGPFYAALGVLAQTRCALQGLGEKMLPLIASVIELVGKLLFVVLLIPRYGYMAVIFCEPVIWCVMAVQLLYAFYRNPYIRGKV
ncbi:MAG: MATE family efflux transporter [Clostridiales bacterium]|nr:MATE family efflux transporter [Clostridiales bacterium]